MTNQKPFAMGTPLFCNKDIDIFCLLKVAMLSCRGGQNIFSYTLGKLNFWQIPFLPQSCRNFP